MPQEENNLMGREKESRNKEQGTKREGCPTTSNRKGELD
jgi:hypothetical protein